LLRETDRGSGGGVAASGVRQRVGREIARYILSHRGARCRACRLEYCRTGHGLGQLRAGRRAASGADVQTLENLRVLPELRRDFHHDVILLWTERVIDRRYLRL